MQPMLFDIDARTRSGRRFCVYCRGWGLLDLGDVVYGYERYERSARYFVFVLDRQVKGCIISFVVWRSAVCFFGKPLVARV